ncbi:helix-turn-helix domain-containing protein [Streptomyces sp. 4.24]|uniref:AraC-like ligand-binding domain-containing protein n=1 Tax=Streptomyces tritrimontium TaxID=3406573 RepID=UPI003BB77CA5
MIWSEFSTDHLPAAERFAHWEHVTGRSLMRTTYAGPHLCDFRAGSRALDLGAVQVFTQDYPPLEVRRSPRQVRQTDPEVYHLWLTVSGRIELNLGSRTAEVGEGDLVLYDSSHPYHGHIAPTGHAQRISSLIVQVPRGALPLRPQTLDRLSTTRIPGNTGLGMLLRTYLTGLTEQGPSYGAADVARLAAATLDLLCATLAQVARAGEELAPETRRAVLRRQVSTFIARNLADPDLTPTGIAAAHHLSVRSLHHLYRDQEVSVADEIRRGRLEGARRDLADPRLRTRSIGAVAAAWGFLDQSYFSRVFRTAYGTTPREHRGQILGGPEVR